MTQKIIKTAALVLKSIDWRDSSKIVSLYTREKGRLDVIAKGARRRNSLFTGILETLNYIEAIIYFSSTRELQHLSQASLEYHFESIGTDLEKTAYALAVLELIYSLLHGNERDATFYDFVKFIFSILDRYNHPPVIFWYFILKLSSYLGFKPQFNRCPECSQEIKSTNAYFQFKNGALLCPTCTSDKTNLYEINEKYYKYLSMLQNTPHNKITGIISFPTPVTPCTNFLLTYLHYHTGQKIELKSLQLIVNN